MDKDTEKINRTNTGTNAGKTALNTGRTASTTTMTTTVPAETGTPLMKAYVRAALTGLAGVIGMLLLTHGRYFKWYFFPMSSIQGWISSTVSQRHTGLIPMESFIPFIPHCAICSF